METQLYIIRDIDPFTINSSLAEVKNTFSKLTYTHLPVLHNQKYIGCIAENDASLFDPNKTLEDYAYAIEPFFVKNEAHWFEILEVFADHNANILPVLDTQNNYLGYFELADIMNLLNRTPFLNESGAVLVIQKGSRDYSFSEISQIIESNNTQILGIFISQHQDEKTQATIKITDTNVPAIIQSFRRYGYEIVFAKHQDQWADKLKDRSNYLSKYLDI